MASEARMVAIAIAVAGSVPPIYLSGAINSARRVKEWAEAQGYETTLISDDKAPVTQAVLRSSIEAALKPSPQPPYRLLVYFAGHGLIREMEEGLWLLSDWRAEGPAIAVEALKRRLFTYGPRQVCIISDACRSLPKDVNQADLTPDALLSIGPNAPDPLVAIDKFAATQDGAETFTIPGTDPEDDRCLFSGVLIEGLWGLDGLRGGPFSKLLPDKVTSRSLGSYLQSEVPARAAMYGLTLNPLVSPTFPEEADYYFTKTVGGASPQFPPWPPKEALLSKPGPAAAPPAYSAPSPAAGIDYGAAPSPDRSVRKLSRVIESRRPPREITALSVITIPKVQERSPRSEAEKKRKWTYCAMPEVAGLWPWMRQGWVLLDDPSDVGSPLVRPGLIEHRPGLMRSRFTTFEPDAGLALAKRFGMQPSDS
jgi:hypothetical protein